MPIYHYVQGQPPMVPPCHELPSWKRQYTFRERLPDFVDWTPRVEAESASKDWPRPNAVFTNCRIHQALVLGKCLLKSSWTFNPYLSRLSSSNYPRLFTRNGPEGSNIANIFRARE